MFKDDSSYSSGTTIDSANYSPLNTGFNRSSRFIQLQQKERNVPYQTQPDIPKKDQIYSDNDEKYGDDEKYESWGDNYVFFPISKRLVDPMRQVGLTPNHVTAISTTFTLLALYYLYNGNKEYACVAYFFGYLFDCVDGKMARTYNMGSKLGMALDLVTDNITNILLVSYITTTKGYFNWYSILIVFMSYMVNLSYGLNEAIASHNAVGHDNFYNRRKNELQGETGFIYDLFLLITYMSYRTYKYMFKEYNEEQLNDFLKFLKHFGPGNFALFMIFILLNY